jgi:glutamate synthase domain-containing protein 2
MQNVPEIAVELGAHGIELKLGQGAKQGLGGEVKLESKEETEKYKKMGYEIIESGGIYERHSLPGSIDKEKLKEKIKKYSKLKVPIWIKVGMGRGIIELIKYLSDLKKKENLPIEAITVDGFGGGTGMSPWLIMNETGIPSCAIFKEMDKNKKMDINIIVAGGICEGTDVAKAIMLGADGVAMGRAFLIAAQTNKEDGVVNFTAALREELQMVCAVLRKKKLTEIKGLRENLFAISQDAKEIFGLKSSI